MKSETLLIDLTALIAQEDKLSAMRREKSLLATESKNLTERLQGSTKRMAGLAANNEWGPELLRQASEHDIESKLIPTKIRQYQERIAAIDAKALPAVNQLAADLSVGATNLHNALVDAVATKLKQTFKDEDECERMAAAAAGATQLAEDIRVYAMEMGHYVSFNGSLGSERWLEDLIRLCRRVKKLCNN